MTHNDFTYKELLKEAYELTRKHFVFLLGLLVINLIIGGIASKLPFIGQLVSIALSVATTCVILLIANGHSPKYEDMLRPFKNYQIAWRYFLATLLMYLAFIAGVFIPIIGYAITRTTANISAFVISLLVFAALAIYYGMRLSFFGFFILDNEHLSPVEALKKSLHMTKHRFWKLAAYGVIFLLLNALGALALVVGLLLTLPMTWLSIALLYKKWSGHEHNGHITTE